MNDITRAAQQPSPDLSENAIQVLRDIDEMRANIAWYREEIERLSKELEFANRDNLGLHAMMSKLEAERGYYQRWTVELITELNTVGDLIGGVMKRAKQGVHRPNGAAPVSALALAKTMEEHQADALPGVVLAGPRIPPVGEQ